MRAKSAKELPEQVALLVVRSGALFGAKWVVERNEMTIGRAPDCDVVIADRQVSRLHARLRRTSEGVLLEDLGSKNGTHVNGSAVSGPVLLHDGDTIQVALAVELTFVESEATLPLTLPERPEELPGALRLDEAAHRVWVNSQELVPPLSHPQFRLLELLYARAGQVVGREEVVEHVWPDTHAAGVSEQAVDALVRRVRERLAAVDPGKEYLVTVRGHGLRLDNQP